MTEQDAKKKRCCGPAPENTGVWVTIRELPASGYWGCSGSECMAWKVSEYHTPEKIEYVESCGHIK